MILVVLRDPTSSTKPLQTKTRKRPTHLISRASGEDDSSISLVRQSSEIARVVGVRPVALERASVPCSSLRTCLVSSERKA